MHTQESTIGNLGKSLSDYLLGNKVEMILLLHQLNVGTDVVEESGVIDVKEAVIYKM